jgi:hypothetical protein
MVAVKERVQAADIPQLLGVYRPKGIKHDIGKRNPIDILSTVGNRFLCHLVQERGL